MKLDENSTITLKLLRIATRRLLQGIVRSCVHEPGPDTVTFVVQRRDSENHQALRSSPSLGFATLCRHCFSLKNSLIFFVNSLIRFSFVFINKITLVFSLKFIFPSCMLIQCGMVICSLYYCMIWSVCLHVKVVWWCLSMILMTLDIMFLCLWLKATKSLNKNSFKSF